MHAKPLHADWCSYLTCVLFKFKRWFLCFPKFPCWKLRKCILNWYNYKLVFTGNTKQELKFADFESLIAIFHWIQPTKCQFLKSEPEGRLDGKISCSCTGHYASFMPSFQATSLRLPVISYNSCLPLVFKSKKLLKIIYISTNQSLLATLYKKTINMMCICMWKSRLPTNSYMHQQLLKPCIQSAQCGQFFFLHFQQFEEKQWPSLFIHFCSEAIQ